MNKDYFYQQLRFSIAWLEKYIEVAKYYSDWEQRKQADDSFIIRKDIYESKNKVLRPLGTSLMLGFEGELDEQPLELREELKQEFYKWLDTSKINADNAPLELKCALFDFHEILECHFEKARRDRDNRKREIENDDFWDYEEFNIYKNHCFGFCVNWCALLGGQSWRIQR